MDDPATTLRNHDLHVTPQRIAILDELRQGGHPSAEKLHDQVNAGKVPASLSTVYDTLDLLQEEGLVATVPTLDGILRYETRTDPHVNRICRECQAITDLEHATLPRLVNKLRRTAPGHVHEGPLVIAGVCQDCAQTG